MSVTPIISPHLPFPLNRLEIVSSSRNKKGEKTAASPAATQPISLLPTKKNPKSHHHHMIMSNNIPRVANGTQACAACKYQRRKCAPDCILAPYFPHDRQRQFLNAHKLFGVSNITKIIRNLDPSDKDEAMSTIIFQSDVRANDPVGGCYRIIRELQRQIEFNKAELDLVLHQLAICRAQSHHHHHIQMSLDDDQDQLNSTTLNCDVINADPLNSYNPLRFHHHQQQQQHHHLHLQAQQEHEYVVHQQNNNNHHLQDLNINTWVIQESALSPSNSLHVKQPFVNECDDIKPLLEIPFERNELKFEDEEAVQASDGAVLNEDRVILREENSSNQHAQDHDLKGAATLFTLTNCNS